MLEVGEKGKNMKGLAVQIVVILVCMNIVHSWVICAKPSQSLITQHVQDSQGIRPGQHGII